MKLRAVAAALLFFVAAQARAEEWYDAYFKGLQALKRRDGEKAVAAFERAIKKRPEPGDGLLTYGTNRVDYHPYLHLAQACVLTGNPDCAREALRRSEASGREPSPDRAKIAAWLLAVAAERARTATTLPTTVAAAPPTTLSPVTTLAPAPPPTEAPRQALRPAGTAATLPAEARPAATLTPSPLPTLPAASPPPEPALASLVVYSEPPGAHVYVDDEPLGATDPASGRLVKSGIAPGPHRVRLAKTGHADTAGDVDVRPEGPTTFRAALAPIPRSKAPLAVGLAVAALVLAALLFWTRRRTPEGPGETVALPPTLRPSTPTRLATPPPATSRTPSARAVGAELETRAIATSVSAAQERFGPYRLVQQLGRGGMASVFEAQRGGESCALKRPLPAFLGEPEFLERFLREAEIGRTLHHPNIIRIFERGEVAGVPYFTMELVQGETLQARVKRSGALPPREGTRVVAQVAEALDYAHLKGVIHRDLKPSNIMVLEDGTVKVMDYGIARARRFDGLTVTGAFLGTPDYVAPETAEGKGTDARSDLYSLGIVFYEILTGQKPFVGETPFATLRKHCTEPPTPPSAIAPGVPRELEAIILKLLRKDPAERYPGAEELLIELREYLNRAA